MVGESQKVLRMLCSVRCWVLVAALGAAFPATPAAGQVGVGKEPLQRPPSEELTLERTVALALLHSADVELARLDVREAELRREEARIDQLAGGPRSEFIEAERLLQAARERFVDTLVDVALQAEEAYYDLLRTAELALIARRSEEQAERQFTVAKTRFEAGLIAKHEYDDVELRREEAAFERLAAEEHHEEARRALLRLVGSAEAHRWAAVEAHLVPLEIELETALSEAEATRREIRQAARDLEAAQENLELLRSTYAAPVELTRAEIALKRAEIALSQAKAAVQADVRQSYAALERAATAERLGERELRLAQQRLAIARARYEAGVIPLVDLVTAEAASMRASLEAVGAVWEYNLQKARFLRKIGRAELPPLPEAIEEFMSHWQP